MRAMRRTVRTILPLILGLGGCGEQPVAPVPAVLELTYDGPATRVLGVEFCIEADVYAPQGGKLEAEVEWGSTAPAVAAVDGEGCVEPMQVGEAAIWAEVVGRGVADTLGFKVVAPVTLALTTEWPAQLAGRVRLCEVELSDAAGAPVEGLEVVWTTSDVGVARVDGGAVQALVPGNVVIVAREPQSGLTDSLEFHVAGVGEPKWKWPVTRGHFASFGGPALGPDGVLYAMTRFGEQVPRTGELHAFDVWGRELWSVELPGVEGNHPTVAPDGSTIYAVGTEGTFAVSREGSILWTTSSLDQSAGIWNGAAVSADGATLYPADGVLLRALQAPTGSLLWESEPSAAESYLVPPTISPDGTRVFAKLASSNLQAFDAETGEVLWSVPDPSTLPDPVVFNNGAVWATGRLFHPLRFSLIELDPGDGEILWQTPEGGSGWSEPAVGSDGTLYLNAANFAWAIRPGDASFIWENREVRPAPAWVGGPALAADGTLYFLSHDGLYALEAATGATIWRYGLDVDPLVERLGFHGAPLIAPDGTVYSYATDTLYAFWEDAPPESDSPWPMWRHDARRSGQAEQ